MSDITRRDFLNGMALSLAAGTTLAPLEALARAPGQATPSIYPPALTGLRGSHTGSFEVAHQVSREGKRFDPPMERTDDPYDLVVVGGGLSGLAAAWYFREAAGPKARILVLDNHDDFGGHAKRLEFDVDGRRLISYGGSQTVALPSKYPSNARRLMERIGFVADRFDEHFDRAFYERYMQPGIFFDGARYAESKLVASPLGTLADMVGVERSRAYEEMIQRFPVSRETRKQLIALFTARPDAIYPGASPEEAVQRMLAQSYEAFIREEHGVGDEGCGVLRSYLKASGTGLGMDSMSVISGGVAMRMPIPGLESLGPEMLAMLGAVTMQADSYIHHFPDGNAAVARMLVRSLIPGSAPGRTQEDIVLARLDYGALDDPASPVRIRLNSTGVDVRHAQDGKSVDVTYVKGGTSYRVNGRHAVMACYNNILPFICPEMKPPQRDALRYASKIPFAYTQVALRRWHAIEKGGFGFVHSPGAFASEFWLDFPVSMGGYQHPRTPDEPIVLSVFFNNTPDGSGLPARDQFRVGRANMLQKSFADYEQAILEQLEAVWGPYGMDPGRDVAAITVNRWPHGYAYHYEPLFDPPEYFLDPEAGPHVAGRAQLNRISIANSDAGAQAMVQEAMEQAHRAVREQLAIG